MPNSAPLFPEAAFTEATSHLRDSQISSSGGVSLSIILAEPVLFLQGFSAAEHAERPPTILRGSLVVSVAKPTKIKTVTLTFKGVSRTEWPEGIPPKKAELYEANDLHSHIWPFFNATFPMAEYSSGAHLVKYAGSSHIVCESNEPSPSSLKDIDPLLEVDEDRENHRRNMSSNSSFRSTSSSAMTPAWSAPGRNRSSSIDSTKAIKGFASKIRRAASPQPSSSSLSVTNSFSGLSLGPHRSFSKKETHDQDIQSKGYRTFEPGEYIYNFELPLPQSLPESIQCNFGSVKYTLEALVARSGTFRSNISGTKDVQIIRASSDNNLEASEPIAISRDWEDQLHYDIVIGGKSFPIGTQIPIAFKFTPLAKVRCHRVRVYVSENCEYYCKKMKVHRIEPTRKFLLKEEIPQEGLQGSLLGETVGTELSSCTELEYMVDIPHSFGPRRDMLHPNTGYENIKVHHWIKLVLRLSKVNPEATDGKRKFYEVSIDSPISLLDNHCTNANLFLPEYHGSRRPSLVSTMSSSMFPIRVGSEAEMRPIHLLRKPSVAPPPFEADSAPPGANIVTDAPPPTYETALAAGPPDLIRVPVLPDNASIVSERSHRQSIDNPAPDMSSTSVNTTETYSSNSSSGASTVGAQSSNGTYLSQSSHGFTATHTSHTSVDSVSSNPTTAPSLDQDDPLARLDEDDPLSSVPAFKKEPQQEDEGNNENIDDEEGDSIGNLPSASSSMSDLANTGGYPFPHRPSTVSSVDLVDQSSIYHPNGRRSSSFAEALPYLSRDPFARQPLLKDISDAASAEEGDLGQMAATDYDDAVSLQSTPSLWIT